MVSAALTLLLTHFPPSLPPSLPSPPTTLIPSHSPPPLFKRLALSSFPSWLEDMYKKMPLKLDYTRVIIGTRLKRYPHFPRVSEICTKSPTHSGLSQRYPKYTINITCDTVIKR
ncbi:hypothetical protein E2C01_072340 [Portunus trituberculatus]|uniref:Uncharacterized protein n=1 Tax=Portunus trituberculatus TaxID=210409 RepID=A0A5B7HXQ0_PORTR|nr:hypothetical protein [Portunus trituberculatus]